MECASLSNLSIIQESLSLLLEWYFICGVLYLSKYIISLMRTRKKGQQRITKSTRTQISLYVFPSYYVEAK